MEIKARTLGIATLVIVLAGGGYFIASEFNRADAPGDTGLTPDADPQQAGMESVPTPSVSEELMRLPESPSMAIAPAPQGKSQAAHSSSNVN